MPLNKFVISLFLHIFSSDFFVKINFLGNVLVILLSLIKNNIYMTNWCHILEGNGIDKSKKIVRVYTKILNCISFTYTEYQFGDGGASCYRCLKLL